MCRAPSRRQVLANGKLNCLLGRAKTIAVGTCLSRWFCIGRLLSLIKFLSGMAKLVINSRKVYEVFDYSFEKLLVEEASQAIEQSNHLYAI